MYSQRLLPPALIAVWLMTACATSPPPVNGPPTLLPAALAVPCPAPVEIASPSCDDTAVTLKQLYDQYAVCAARLFELIGFVTAPRKPFNGSADVP